MSGGGGFDPGKELAQLDKDLSLSQNAPLIASATATYFGVPLSPVEMGAILGAGRAIDKGSVSEGINWGLQGYGGASLGAALPGAAAAPAAAATPAASAIPVETAVPVPVTSAVPAAPVPMGGPDLVANAGASAVPAPSGVASLADMYGGPAAPAASPPSNLDEMKRRLGPLGWATRSLDGFLKVLHRRSSDHRKSVV